uniref:Uncharacterized protein n=1 Tax=Molossus molossus TaxID=27622 RepID=A0A7J8BN55_MOLMO|nr:hypothetical protein HJG59_010125 [Molossus molossus]
MSPILGGCGPLISTELFVHTDYVINSTDDSDHFWVYSHSIHRCGKVMRDACFGQSSLCTVICHLLITTHSFFLSNTFLYIWLKYKFNFYSLPPLYILFVIVSCSFSPEDIFSLMFRDSRRKGGERQTMM